MTFQELIAALNEYWAKQGCVILQPHDVEVGAGTFHPATSLRTLGPEPWRVAYVQPSRRPADGRYGENPYRLGHYYQYQVILKPAPPDSQDVYLNSLFALGLDPLKNDFRFVEDDWESPTLGASGLGWEIWCNGAEVTQYTYFQQIGSIEVNPICVELTYGLERVAMYLQGVSSLYDVRWNEHLLIGDVIKQGEWEYSTYYLETSSTEMLFQWFGDAEQEVANCLSKGLVLPALDFVMKASHTFNMLDARGAISVTERVGYIGRVRGLARRVARAFVEQREALGHPLMGKFPVAPAPIQAPAKPAAEPKTTTADLLYEIGTEEIPAGTIEPALQQIRDRVEAWLKEQRLSYDSIRTLATPRRLTLSVTNLATRQEDIEVEVAGPPKSAAFDADGNPTKAAQGFARGQGVPVESLTVRQTEKGEYLYARKAVEGQLTEDLLAAFLPKLTLGLNFPKTMRWENLRFARPIRWLVALFGDAVIDFPLDSLRAGNITRGHRFLGASEITLTSANLDAYTSALAHNAVIVDPAERKAKIRALVEETLHAEGSPVLIDESLLDQVTYLVENPQTVVGTFDEAHLETPTEVLVTSMKKHQRYFPVYSVRGTHTSPLLHASPLQAKFITISNGTDGHLDNVRVGNERVLRARLEDASFFWKEDRREPLESRVESLRRVTFSEKLGTLYEKTERVKRLTGWLAQSIGADAATAETVSRAAWLCKADLVTQMVFEFPELQGTMGKYYALQSGEATGTATAIEEHYRPTSAESPLPESLAGTLLSVADKMDTVVGYFGVGMIPTGSQDPFSLRRQTIGICRILLEKRLPGSLYALIRQAVEGYGDKFSGDCDESVKTFFRARLEVMLGERGYAYDEVDAVLSAGFEKVSELPARLDALAAFRKSGAFESVYPALNRVLRILPDDAPKKFSQTHLVDEAEINLARVLKHVRPELDSALVARNFAGLLDSLGKLQANIDFFFEKVLVMDADPNVRGNRLALLGQIAAYVHAVGDLRKLVIAG